MITAANTCVADGRPGSSAPGATPVLADVDEETWTLDPASAEAAVTERTRAIVPVHLYGQCADLEPLARAGARARAEVVEDAAQAHGAEYEGSAPGRSATRPPTASTRPRTWARSATPAPSSRPTRSSRRSCGGCARTASAPRRAGSPSLPGVNSRLDEVQAEVLLGAGSRAWTTGNERRRELAARYLERARRRTSALPVEADGTTPLPGTCSSCWRDDRDAFRARLRERGVETLVHYPEPIHRAAGVRAPAARSTLPVSERLCEQVVSLPLYPELTDAEAEQVVAAVLAG